MSDIKINNITDRSGSSGPVFAGISTVSTSAFMVMPSGPTEYRGGRGRGVAAGGETAPARISSMEFIEIATTGNATDFGDMSEAKMNLTGASSSTRGVIMGGTTPVSPNFSVKSIEYTIISSGGGGSDFGDLVGGQAKDSAGVSSAVRGFACGATQQSTYGNYNNNIEFITFATTGNSAVFADLAHPGKQLNAGCESSTRGIVLGGYDGSTPANPDATNNIQFFNFASTGNTIVFGELTQTARNVIAVSDQTRGVRMGGFTEPANAFVEEIDFITMATTGNATDFGNLLGLELNGAPVQNKTRGVMMGSERPGSSQINIIQYITIQSAGNATDFGDLAAVRAGVPAGLCDINGTMG